MRSNCRTSRRIGRAVCIASASLIFCGGCQTTAAFFAAMQGGDVIEPQYTLTTGPLLVLIDDRNDEVTNPKATREVFQTISDIFLEFDVNRRIVPYEEIQRLARDQGKFDKMSIRAIGEKLGADQILYINIENFTLHREEGAPLFEGEFIARIKVLSTERIHDTRLWPTERAGHRVAATTPKRSSEGEKSESDVAGELGIKLGQNIAGLFYEHREFADK